MNKQMLKIHNLRVVQSIEGWKKEDLSKAMYDADQGIEYDVQTHTLNREDSFFASLHECDQKVAFEHLRRYAVR